MKEKHKLIARDLSETDISNMPNGEFKANIKIITELEKTLEDISETLATEIKLLKQSKRDEEYNK